MRRRLVQLALGIGAGGWFLLLTSQVAYADHCGSFIDCFDTTDAAIAAAVFLGLLIALGIGLGAIALEAAGEAIADAAAEGLIEGAEEAVGEMAGEASVGAEEGAAEAAGESNFASEGKLIKHFGDHGPEFGDITQDQYLQGARNLTRGGEGIDSFVRPNGDTIYYNPSTNEFGVKTSDNIIRTYFKPREGLDYWVRELSKFGGHYKYLF